MTPMKTSLDCIPCFLRQALASSRLVSDDRAVHEDVVDAVVIRKRNEAIGQFDLFAGLGGDDAGAADDDAGSVELSVVEGGTTARDMDLLLTPPLPGADTLHPIAFPRQKPTEGWRSPHGRLCRLAFLRVPRTLY